MTLQGRILGGLLFYLNIMIEKINIKQSLDYEVRSHWLASYISFGCGQELMAMYLSWKVKRKYKRYSYSIEMKKLFKQ